MRKSLYLFIYNLLSFVSCHISSKRIIRWKLIAGGILLCINGHSKTQISFPENTVLQNNDTIQNNSLKKEKTIRTITGTIVDKENEPLIGVNILIKGTNIGINSDLDGNFSLDTPSDSAKILITYIGYESVELDIPASSPFVVVLEEQESNISCYIVITGYDFRSKEEREKDKIEIKIPKKKLPFINKKDTTQTK